MGAIPQKVRLGVYAVILALLALLLVLKFTAAPGLARQAASGDAGQRLDAAADLADQPGGRATALLAQLAQDPEPAVAFEAIGALGKRDTDAAHVALHAVAHNASLPAAVRGGAIGKLGRSPATTPADLSPWLAPAQPPALRAGAARALSHATAHHPDAAAPVVYRLLRDPEPSVRRYAAQGITTLTGQRFPQYDPAQPPAGQAQVLGYIRQKLNEAGHAP